MKYNDLPKEEKEKLNGYLVKQAAQQSENGRELFENISKSILYANTGGVAVTSSLIAAGPSGNNVSFLGLSFLLFVLGVALFIVFRFHLSLAVGRSVEKVKQFHHEVIDGLADVSGDSINTRMAKISGRLDGNTPMWVIFPPMLMFIIGATLGCSWVVLRFVV
ncbi:MULTISPECIES: hypothetical protein [unclassified Marinobacter]|uniref:Uncharacterized protein n=1 Tax=Marinobacter nauticus TaxID=2743 RepID=A0A455W503_MARNT|nr:MULTISPECIES: hypothetical protein [unclassified Marinobacter]QFS89016.1 hypothetical protein FIV08_19405 [Marinobacter sp. THAF197a]QFT52801.1 hypothetical protein FIU96_19310 [Marinobacter sp. THAF39]BBJ04396.1 hypothetical protein YBY_22450 [Marinobacter nauticus]